LFAALFGQLDIGYTREPILALNNGAPCLTMKTRVAGRHMDRFVMTQIPQKAIVIRSEVETSRNQAW
jgi:hypothetical protein